MRSETHDPLLRALRLLELRPRRVLTAVAAGVATLGSALALAALSAWLITRAWEMPPVLDLSVAVVAVRALGISRGVFRYLERLTTHDVALRGTTAARSRIYQQLAAGDPAAAAGLRRGDLLSRTGADVDALGDVRRQSTDPDCGFYCPRVCCGGNPVVHLGSGRAHPGCCAGGVRDRGTLAFGSCCSSRRGRQFCCRSAIQ